MYLILMTQGHKNIKVRTLIIKVFNFDNVWTQQKRHQPKRFNPVILNIVSSDFWSQKSFFPPRVHCSLLCVWPGSPQTITRSCNVPAGCRIQEVNK